MLTLYGRHLGGQVLIKGVPAQVVAAQDSAHSLHWVSRLVDGQDVIIIRLRNLGPERVPFDR
jgi:hypothetical protein